MNLQGTITYKKTNIRVINVGEEHKIYIRPLNQNVARIYFVDLNGLEIDIPRNYRVEDSITQEDIVPFMRNFIISIIANYNIFRGQVLIASINNQKQQSLASIHQCGTIRPEDANYPR